MFRRERGNRICITSLIHSPKAEMSKYFQKSAVCNKYWNSKMGSYILTIPSAWGSKWHFWLIFQQSWWRKRISLWKSL